MCSPPLFAVADGMGGAQAGELASRLAAASLEEFRDHGEQTAADLVQEANARIYRRSREDPAAAGMGSTITVALVDGTPAPSPWRTWATRAPISCAAARSSS